MRFPRYAAYCLMVLILTVGLGCSKSKEPEGNAPKDTTPTISEASRKAPDFEAKALDGTTVKLSDLKGKVVLLDFWATWCPPCVASIPHLRELQQKYADKGLVVIGMSLDTERRDVEIFMKKNPIPYKVVLTPRELSQTYKVSSIPRIFVIDREGNIKGDFLGFTKQVGENIEASAVAAMNR